MFARRSDRAARPLRLAFGAIFLAYVAQKLFGVAGGPGLAG